MLDVGCWEKQSRWRYTGFPSIQHPKSNICFFRYRRKMHAIVLESPGPVEGNPLRVKEAPKPAPGPGEVLIKVRVCGVCRTDLHVVEGELPPRRSPIIPGHQAIGTV